MNKLIKNSELIKRCLLVGLSLILIIISLTMFSLSFQNENDGWGTDVSFDMDSVVIFLCGLSFLCYGIYSIYAYKKKISCKTAYYGAAFVTSALLAFYPLGVFFKAMAKGKPFLENQEYLYVGILGVVLLIYLGFSYLADTYKK